MRAFNHSVTGLLSAKHPAGTRLSHLSLSMLAISALSLSGTAMANEDSSAALQSYNLPAIVLTASGFEQKLTDAPASITVIQQKDLLDKRINSIADALTDVEGIDISPTAGKTGGLNVRMRGMDAEYSLILIDGQRQNSTGDITPNGFGESNNNFIPPVSAIKRIEVIRGPMSTLYGSDAMGGVINIITKKVADEWTGELKLDATLMPNSSDFGNQRAAEIYLSGPLLQDKLGLQIRARKWQRDQSEVSYVADDGSDVELSMGNNPTKGDIENAGIRLSFTPSENHVIWLDAENTRQSYDNSKSQLGTLGANGGYDTEQNYERSKYVLAHTWESKIGTLSSSIASTTSETEGRLIPSRAQNNSMAITPRLLKSEDVIVDSKFNTQAVDAHNINIGMQWWEASIHDGLRQKKEISFKQLGLFAEDTWSLSDSLALTVGLRYDDHDTFGDFFTPRAYLVWNGNEQWTFKGGYSEGYKAPRLERLTSGIYNVGGQGRTPLFGNPDLKPETSKNLEFGTYFNNLAGWKANATVFYSEIEDKIVSGNTTLRCNAADPASKQACEAFMLSVGTPWLMDPSRPDTWNVSRPTNAEKASVHGIELASSLKFLGNFLASINYTWTKTELDDAALGKPPLTDTPEHMLNASLKWQADDNISLWARAEYRSDRARYTTTYDNLDASQKNIYDHFGDYKAYALLHLGSNFAVNDHWDIGVAMYNVFDKDFMRYELVPNTTTSYVNRYSNSQEGRRIQLSTTFKF